MRFLARRALHSLYLLLLVSLGSFLLVELAPGDFLSEMKLNPQISEQTLEVFRARFGMDQPVWLRYLRWGQSVLSGDWGFSFAYNGAVAPLLWERTCNTLLLSGAALVLTWVIGLAVGIWTASHVNSWLSRAVETGMATLLATPDLLLALACLLLAVHTGWFPSGGFTSAELADTKRLARLKDQAAHLLLPAACLTASLLPVTVSHVHTAMVETLNAPFLVAARAHGISGRRLLFRHALPVAVNPLLSLFGLGLGTLLSSSLLVEVVMSWPGMGRLLLEAILQRDLFVLLGIVLASTIFLIAGNLVADCLLHLTDPRIRTN